MTSTSTRSIPKRIISIFIIFALIVSTISVTGQFSLTASAQEPCEACERNPCVCFDFAGTLLFVFVCALDNSRDWEQDYTKLVELSGVEEKPFIYKDSREDYYKAVLTLRAVDCNVNYGRNDTYCKLEASCTVCDALRIYWAYMFERYPEYLTHDEFETLENTVHLILSEIEDVNSKIDESDSCENGHDQMYSDCTKCYRCTSPVMSAHTPSEDNCTRCANCTSGIAGASHNFSDDIASKNATHHDFKCANTCAVRGGDVAHAASNQSEVDADCTIGDLVCDDCGYVMKEANSRHTFTEKKNIASISAAQHNYECNDCTTLEVEAHAASAENCTECADCDYDSLERSCLPTDPCDFHFCDACERKPCICEDLIILLENMVNRLFLLEDDGNLITDLNSLVNLLDLNVQINSNLLTKYADAILELSPAECPHFVNPLDFCSELSECVLCSIVIMRNFYLPVPLTLEEFDNLTSWVVNPILVAVRAVNAANVPPQPSPPSSAPTPFVSVEDYVTGLYWGILNRAPDQGGLDSWVAAIRSGAMTAAEVERAFMFSEEAKGLETFTDDELFIENLYLAVLGRNSDSTGKSHWLAALKSGAMSHEEIYDAFTNSLEYEHLRAETYVTGLYEAALGRDPDEGGLASWTDALKTGKITATELVRSFIFSEELLANPANNDDGFFVEILYQSFFGRASDAGGKTSWVGALTAGMARVDVFNSFASSQEFDYVCKAYGLVK